MVSRPLFFKDYLQLHRNSVKNDLKSKKKCKIFLQVLIIFYTFVTEYKPREIKHLLSTY